MVADHCHRFLFVVAFSASCASSGCGDPGPDPNETSETGGSSAATGGGSAETGGARAETGGAGTQPVGSGGRSAGTGGASSSSGGKGSGGTGGQATGGGIGTGGDICAMVGCAAPPLCAEGCMARCGCCPCAEGEARDIDGVKHECMGGCWAPVEAACEYHGASYSPGATFPADDGCNDCDCLADGVVSCTQMDCPPCDPDAELYVRSYVADSPETCAVIDFVCPGNTKYFGNDCGCGCEQSPTCPEWFDCMPTVGGGAPCDEEAIRVECPYSGIAY